MAICGSTNAVLHLSAIANEAELGMDVVREFAELNKTTPQIAKVNPAAKWDMEDFYRAGGIPRVMQRLGDILDTSLMTCTGKTIKENLEGYKFAYPENPEIIKTVEEPFSKTGGVAVLEGNLAPNTAISKPGAIDPALHHFVGKARCFDSEEAAEEAILGGVIQPGEVVVIRYEGPKGGFPRNERNVQGYEIYVRRRTFKELRPYHRRTFLRNEQRLLRRTYFTRGR